MKTQGKIWVIYDAETKTQTKPMSVVQAQVTLLSLASKDPGKFFLWTPGWEEWVCVRKFLESDQKYFVVAQPPKPVDILPAIPTETMTATHSVISHGPHSDSPYTQVVSGDTPLRQDEFGGYHEQDFNGDELDLSKIKKIKPDTSSKKKPQQTESSGSDRRRDPRHNFKIEIVLVSKERSFRTYSKNMSISGTLLEDEIPRDFLNKPFDLIIVNPFESDPAKARLLFKAKIVGDMKDSRRLTFIEQDPTMTLRLDALLKAYVAYQTQMKLNAG